MTSNVRLMALSTLVLAALAVTGCKKSTVVAENESAESVAEKVAKSGISIKPKPGRWESSVKIENLEMPNMPPEAKAAMQQHMNTMQHFVSCLTPAEAEKPNAGFFQKGASGCTYDKFVMSDGKMDALMHCNHGGQTQTMAMSGTYGEESYNITVKSDAGKEAGMPMSMTMSITSKRVGECRGDEEK